MTASKNEPLSVISRLDALIEQALHLAKAPPFTDIPIKMRALSVNLNEVLPQIIVMHHCIYQKRPARSASLFS